MVDSLDSLQSQLLSVCRVFSSLTLAECNRCIYWPLNSTSADTSHIKLIPVVITPLPASQHSVSKHGGHR